MTEKEFRENGEGVHLMAINGEHTVCGDSHDLYEDLGDGAGPLKYTLKNTVTCARCVAVIEHCKLIKTRQPAQKKSHQ